MPAHAERLHPCNQAASETPDQLHRKGPHRALGEDLGKGTGIASPAPGLNVHAIAAGSIHTFGAASATLVAAGRSENALREEFNALSTQWHAETRHCSMVWQYVLHDAYQRIVVGMGKDALPLILEDLRDHGGYWFQALELMAGEDPAAGATSRTEAVDAWLAWGRRSGLI